MPKFYHNPDDTCGFSSAEEYNAAFRKLYGDVFEDVSPETWDFLTANRVCPIPVAPRPVTLKDTLSAAVGRAEAERASREEVRADDEPKTIRIVPIERNERMDSSSESTPDAATTFRTAPVPTPAAATTFRAVPVPVSTTAPEPTPAPTATPVPEPTPAPTATPAPATTTVAIPRSSNLVPTNWVVTPISKPMNDNESPPRSTSQLTQYGSVASIIAAAGVMAILVYLWRTR